MSVHSAQEKKALQGSQAQRARRIAGLAASVVTLTVLVAFAGSTWNRLAERGWKRDQNLRRIGFAFQKYVAESEGEVYPPVSPVAGLFHPDLAEVQHYLGGSGDPQDLIDYLTGSDGIEVCYLGFALPDERMAQAVLSEYDAFGPERLRGDDIRLSEPIERKPWGAIAHACRLRAGVERFCISEVMSVAANNCSRSELPILWEIPDPPKRRGGWVLYMDGHCEWQEYPGEFPMTEPFIERIREFMASAG